MNDYSDKKPTNIIKANRLLQAKVGVGPVDEETIKKAQEVMSGDTTDFVPFANDLLDQLEQIIESDLQDAADPHDLAEDITQTIMQLKANAAMFNYSLVGNLANIMLNFLETVERIDQDVVDIVRAHEKTLRLIVTNKMSGDGGENGKVLQSELKDACKRYFAKQNQ